MGRRDVCSTGLGSVSQSVSDFTVPPRAHPSTGSQSGSLFLHPSQKSQPSLVPGSENEHSEPTQSSFIPHVIKGPRLLATPMKLFTYYRYRLIFSAGRERARAVLDVLVLVLALVVVVVVWEEYQGKQLACPLLQRPGGAA